MQLGELVNTLTAMREKYGDSIEVEVAELVLTETTFSLSSVEYVERWDFRNSSCERPSILLFAEE